MAAKKKKARKKTGKRRAHSHKKARKKSSKRRRKSVGSHHKAHTKAGTSYGSKASEFIRAHDLLARAKKKRGKRWSCKGPVRSGCGGSGSRVTR